MTRKKLIIVATGHRLDHLTLHLGHEVPYTNLIALARRELSDLRAKSVIVGMATGWDLAVGAAAMDLGLPITAAIPFPNQTARFDLASLVLWQRVLAKASQVVHVSWSYDSGAFQRRNEWMVDRAELVLALFGGWNGGTKNCVRYALAQGKRVENCWSRLAEREGAAL